jgi:hypothetical protein
MNDTVDAGPDNNDPFDTIDPRLTVFALANGMDLAKSDGSRRLEWFTEGLERGILIEAADDGRYDVKVLCWRTGSGEEVSSASVGEAMAAEEVTGGLSDVIETANGLSA